MKEYILFYLSRPSTYLPLIKAWDKNSLSSLFSLLFGDFRPRDNDFLHQDVNLYNAHFIYHDFKNKLLYIGFGEWLIDSDIDGPSWDEFSDYVNEENSCKMSVDNYLEFRDKWIQLKKDLPPFALIYRDNFDWVNCKGFDTQEAMENFVKNYKDEVVH
ncbi:MAG: hypothetical protein ACXWL2_04860 [Candidatus Chromulinivorax sp.]